MAEELKGLHANLISVKSGVSLLQIMAAWQVVLCEGSVMFNWKSYQYRMEEDN